MLIAGDLFHRQPLLRELKEVNYLFSTLTDTQIVLMAGNHDCIRKHSYYRTFSWHENVHMITSRDISCIKLRELDTAVYGLSYYEKENEGHVYESVKLQDSCRYRILLAHGGDEKHFPFHKAAVERLGFDYVALGHIHKPQELIPNRMAYSGALEPIDRNDTGRHGIIKGELGDSGCKIKFQPAASREYVHITIEVDADMTGFALRTQLRQRIEAGGVQNIYKVTLEGVKAPEIIFDLENMNPYGNVTEIVDHTKPSFDFKRMLSQNRNNLMGRYIESFGDARPGSVEYEALCEGILALQETKRG